MRTDHFLFHVLGVTSGSRVKILHSKRVSLSPRFLLLCDDFDIILTSCFKSRCSISYFVLHRLFSTI